ncbi:glycosyltransferase family 2 protein [Thermoleptolyngbya sp.]|jgi:glycosyltransferase involved in cell wall biosynthesis
MTPLVSVVVTAFNQARFLKDAVNSVLQQDYKNIECWIINDGSSDDTEAIAQGLMQQDVRVYYQAQPNGGVSAARNRGARCARGEWVQFLDGDDWIAPDKLSRQLAAVAGRNPDRLVIYSDYERVEQSGQHQRCEIGSQSPAALAHRLLICPDRLAASPFPLLQQTMLLHRSVLAQFSFDETLRACEDRAFGLALLRGGAQFVYVPMVAAFYRQHGANLTQNARILRQSYGALFHWVGDRHPDLLPDCQRSLHNLLDATLEAGEYDLFRAIAPLVQFPSEEPLRLFGGTLPVVSHQALQLAEALRRLLPARWLYPHRRGPKLRSLLARFGQKK